MTDYELKMAAALENQFGANWYLHGSHPQTILDYLQAKDDASRLLATERMRTNAIHYASSVLQAGLMAGIVAIPG